MFANVRVCVCALYVWMHNIVQTKHAIILNVRWELNREEEEQQQKWARAHPSKWINSQYDVCTECSDSQVLAWFFKSMRCKCYRVCVCLYTENDRNKSGNVAKKTKMLRKTNQINILRFPSRMNQVTVF